MYSKDELMEKDAAELAAIAKDIDARLDSDGTKEQNVYAILDRQAEVEGTKNPLTATKRKRTRITKKDTDHVYSVSGKDGENFDLKKGKPTPAAKPKADTTADTAAAPAKPSRTRRTKAAADETPQPQAETTETAEAEQPKKRTRRTKAEDAEPMQAELPFMADAQPETAATEEQKAEEPQTQAPAAAEAPATDGHDDAPDFIAEQLASQTAQAAGEESAGESTPDDDTETSLMQTLKENVGKAMTGGRRADTVWDGDPGDGTDFITIEDLPVIDTAAMPVNDIFDMPVNNTAANDTPAPASQEKASNGAQTAKYNFDGLITANGVLEVMPDGYGFLRSSDYNYLSSPDDVYVSNQQVKSNGLKTGDVVECHVRPPHDGEKYFPLTSIDKINGRPPSEVRDRVAFEHLTPLFPDEKFTLCGEKRTTNLSTRIVDLFSPIGKGQRALIVAQPKTGKTMLMKNIANAIAANHPEAYLMMLLIDERPEEVTDMARTVDAEVIASTFDEPAERHVKIAGIVLEKAKRMVECGHDVVIFLDSITRLARAYNTVAPASGKVLTGGVDANALQKPKRFFGAARNIEGGGSLTIIATALIDTGSKMDEVIFEEFKGTGNMELQLDRQLSNKRKFPAINLVASSTRRDDLLHTEFVNDKMAVVRQYIADMNTLEAWTTVERCMERSTNTEEFIMAMNS